MTYIERHLLVALKEAIEEEIGQQQKYQDRASQAQEAEMKALFLFLLEEEKKHEALLKKELSKVKIRLGEQILADIE